MRSIKLHDFLLDKHLEHNEVMPLSHKIGKVIYVPDGILGKFKEY